MLIQQIIDEMINERQRSQRAGHCWWAWAGAGGSVMLQPYLFQMPTAVMFLGSAIIDHLLRLPWGIR